MLYEKYERRVRRTFFVIRQIKHFRILLITIAAIAFFSLSGFSVSKGIIYDVSIPDTYEYSDQVEFTSKAVFSNISYSYRKVGDTTWTDEQPTEVGDYQVEIKSDQVFGRENTKIIDFTITAKTVSLSLESTDVVFGDTPVIQADLGEGDYIDHVEFSYESLASSNTVAYIDNITIKDAAGHDVTSSYNLENTSFNVHFLPREVTVSLLDVSKIYNGQVLTSNDYTITNGSIADGNTLTITSSGSQLNVGSSLNTILSAVVQSNGEDVSSNYHITYVDGTLEVTTRSLVIETDDDSKVYDGTALSNSGYRILDGSLITGQTIQVVGTTEQTNIGTTDNVLTLQIIDGNGNDVTSNYDITYVYGELQVTTKQITIETTSDSKVYDGTALSNNAYTITNGSLNSGDVLNIISTADLTNVGTMDNQFVIQIEDANGNDVTNNYDISYVYGQLEVTLRAISIEATSDSKVYDGTPLYNENYTITSGSLASGDAISITAHTAITNVGVVDNVLTFDVTNAEAVDVSSNYDITVTTNSLEVTARVITVQPLDVSSVYDGTSITSTTADVISGTLATGQVIDITTTGSQLNVGTSLSTIDTITISDNGVDVTSNYDITLATGTLEITARPITIDSASASKEYDTTPLFDENYTISAGTLATDETMSILNHTAITDVGTTDNVLTIEIRNLDNIDVTNNYAITYVNGTLEITARALTIQPANVTKVYDGTSLTSNTATVTSGTLLNGQTITITTSGSQLNVGTSLSTIDTVVINDGTTDVTGNYNIVFTSGTLEVTARPLTITTNSDTKVYDGSPLSNQNYSITFGSLVSGDTITVTNYTDITNVGTTDNVLTLQIKDSNLVEVSSNYTITYLNGTLEVTPRPLSITTSSDTKGYDQTALSNQNYTITSGTLVSGDTINVTSYSEQTNVGSTSNILTIEILDSGATDVTSNYNVTFVYGTLEVTPRMITITTSNDTKVYDGTILSNPSYTITDGVLAASDAIIVTGDTSILNVGVVNNVLTIQVQDSQGTDVTSNYDVVFVYGQLEITPRPLTISTNSDTKVYDGSALSNTNYSITSGTLVSGQTLNIIGDTTITNVGVVNNVLTFDITDLNAIDVTGNYDIITVNGSLEVTARPLTIQTSSDSKVYDGTPLSNQNYVITSGSLVFGDHISVASYTDITNVGVVDNVLSLNINDLQTNNVTGNYNITYINGTLEVTSRFITIQPTYATHVYDGTTFASTAVSVITGSLASGQTLSITTSGSQLNVGTSTNTIVSATVYDGITNVSSNYTITYQTGTLEVTPRMMTIEPTYASKIYDGTPLTSSAVTVISGSLANGQTLNVTTTGSQTNVGTSNNTLVSATVYDGVVDVTSNYNITFQVGTLEVTPRPLTITTNSDTKVYDGTALSNQNYSITSGTLVAGETLNIIGFTSITNVGTSDNILTFEVRDSGNVDVTTNYSITYVNGTLEITPRPLTISTNSDSKVYDGTTLSNQNYSITSGTLVAGDTINVLQDTSIINVSTVDNVLTLQIVDSGAVDVTSNYVITYVNGTLEITPRPITITTNSDTKVYDGTALSNQNYSITSGSLAAGETLSIVDYTSIINVGVVDNVLTPQITNSSVADVTSNYAITYVNGSLEVTSRAITITSSSSSKVYDGTPLIDENYTITSGSLATGDTITVTSNTSITNVGVVDNILTISIANGAQTDVTNNYTITYVNGTLEVTPRPITITTSSDTKVYDDTPLFNENYTITSGSLATGDTIAVINHTDITNVGVINNTLTLRVDNPNLVDVTTNYTITYVEGTLEITPRPITIQTENASKEYDGTALSDQNYTITQGSLVGGQTITVSTFTELTNVNVVDNVLGLAIKDANNVDKTSNYQITYTNGFLEVTPRMITVSTAGAIKVYDGTPLTDGTWQLSSGTVLPTDVLSITVTGTITNVGKVFNSFTYTIVDGSSNDVSMNYTVVENLGVLEVQSANPVLVIQSNSDSKVYDGTPLTNSEWILYDGTLNTGDTLQVTMTGTITNVGVVDNTFTYTILDANNNDVTAQYDVQVTYGTLTIVDANANGTNTSTSTSISTDGTLTDQPPQVVLQVYSEVNDVIYLRDKSYGDYNKTGWDAPTVYSSPYGTTPFLFPNIALNNTQTAYQLQVKSLVTGESYYVPYYATDGFYDNINDVYVNHPYGLLYTINYVPMSSVDYTTQTISDPVAQGYEQEYRQFVYNTYLQLPRETKDALLQIAADNGLDPNSPTIIDDVKNYIQNAAVYNEAYAPIPSNVDVALYFLQVSREGVCQHFATAGVAMYRALGIPARYVTGYYVQTTANSWVDVNTLQRHAWVEIYVDGFGWAPVEVTGTNVSGSSSGFGSTPSTTSTSTTPGTTPTDLIPIDIYSGNDSKMYDGTPLTNSFHYYIGSLRAGDTLSVTMTGSITAVGTADNTFTYVVTDSNGVDVTNLYSVNPIYGSLQIVPVNNLEIIEFQPYDVTTTYNGETIFANSADYWIPSQNLPAGYTVQLEIVGQIDGVGTVSTYINKASIKILDQNQIDVTSNYNIVTYTGSITVIKRNITVTSFSASKYYDGTALTSDVYYVSSGSLATGDTMAVTITGTITDPGTTPNSIGSVVITNANGVDVTSYYNITKVEGTLTVIP